MPSWNACALSIQAVVSYSVLLSDKELVQEGGDWKKQDVSPSSEQQI